MRKIEISGKMPSFGKIFSSMNFIVLGAVFLIMLLVTVSFGSTVYDSYAQAKENEQKIAEMEKYIADWMEKSEVVNNSKMHPVKLEDLDKVQTVLLTSLKQYNLNITGFQALKTPVTTQNAQTAQNNQNPAQMGEQNKNGQEAEKKQQKKANNYHDYELNVEGSYSNVVNFLNSIHQNNILISIRNLKLQQQQGVIKADLKYRVYTK